MDSHEKEKQMGGRVEHQQPAGTLEKLKEHFTMPTAPAGAVVQFNKFHNRFKHLFQTKTRSLTLQSYQYLKGLFQASKKNMERMAEAVPDSNDQRFQHFLSKSPWDEDAVIDKLAQEANGHIGGHPTVACFWMKPP